MAHNMEEDLTVPFTTVNNVIDTINDSNDSQLLQRHDPTHQRNSKTIKKY